MVTAKTPGKKRAASKVLKGLGWCLGLTEHRPDSIHDRLLLGLPFKSVEMFVVSSGLKQQDILEAAQLPASTLSRRKKSAMLEPAESARLFRVAQVFERAADLFEGDAAAARRWLMEPVRGLGQRVPLELARTQVGAQLVLDLIGRLEFGVFT